MARLGYLLFLVVGNGTVVLSVLVPLAVTLWGCVQDGVRPADGWMWSGRQSGLLVRSVLLALAGAGLAFVPAAPAAAALGCGVRRRGGRWLVALVVCPLLLSPTVMTFGWARVLGRMAASERFAEVMCVWCRAAWLWPIPALVLGAAWRSSGRSAYEAALLETGRFRALRVGAVPALRGPALCSLLVLIVLCLADYNVAHACGLQVYATEILAWASNYRAPVHVVWASIPPVAVMGMVVVGAWWASGSGKSKRGGAVDVRGPIRGASTGWGWLVGGLMVGVPIVGLAGRLGSTASFATMGQTYGREIAESFSLALAGGLLGVWAGLAAVNSGSLGRVLAIVLFAAGFLPGALMGKALVVSYVGVPLVYDHWPIVVLAYAGRYGWIGVASGWLLRHAAAEAIEDMARVDGAGTADVFWRVRVGTGWPAVVAAWLVASGMSLTDLATAPQVVPPQYGLLSVILVEKFHRFEEQMLVSISLTLLAVPVLAVLVFGVFLRQEGGRART